MPGITSFIVNGKTYGRLDEMPPEIRAVYDKALQQLGAADPDSGQTTTSRFTSIPGLDVSTVQFNSVKTQTMVDAHRSYDRIEDLPPHARRTIESAIASLGSRPKLPAGIMGWVIALIVLVAVLVVVLVL